jgi:octaprenyl-diphosphate synthase
VRLLCDVTLRMIEGELYQLTKAGDVTITEDEHFEIIRRKTAYLFSGCAEIGGLLGACTPDQRVALREYGFDLGIAFQIVDDVLDFTADESALGKPIGGDLREGKVTLPVILLLQNSPHEMRELVSQVVADRRVSPEAWRTIREALERTQAIDLAFDRAVTHAGRAKQTLLSAFPTSLERDNLIALADYVLSRDR